MQGGSIRTKAGRADQVELERVLAAAPIRTPTWPVYNFQRVPASSDDVNNKKFHMTPNRKQRLLQKIMVTKTGIIYNLTFIYNI